MLKKTITYEDWDGNSVTEDLYFNLTRTELADNLHLKDELEALAKRFEARKGDLEVEEIQAVLDLVKKFAQMSYGVRSEDGKRFSKKPELWEEFMETAAYDAFMIELFSDEAKSMEWMLGIMPKELRDDLERDVRTQQKLPESLVVKEPTAWATEPATKATEPDDLEADLQRQLAELKARKQQG